MAQCSTTSFSGQDVYCGFDVHKSSWEVCVRINGVQAKAFHAPADVPGIVSTLRSSFPGARFHSVYEAGFCGFQARRALVAAGFDNIVVNPADVPTSGRERAFKCDRLDCRKLARHLEAGDLHCIDVPSPAQERMRSLVRRETQVRDAATRCGNQLKGAIYFHGLRPVPGRLPVAALRELEAEAAAADDPETLSLVRQLRFLRKERAQVMADERRLQKELGFSEDVRLLTSIPGIGPRAASVIQAELGDVSRFRTRNRLASYVGLSPHLNGSGEGERAKASGERKKKELHYLLIQAAWIAAGRDPALCAHFCRQRRGHRKTRAIVGVARKLLFIIYAVLRSRKPYDARLFLERHPGLEAEPRKGGIPRSCAEAAEQAASADEEDALMPGVVFEEASGPEAPGLRP